MKKKGFTLVEMIAVLAITSLLLIMIGGIYVSGMKTTTETKEKADIENQYRRTYDGLKKILDDGATSIKPMNKKITVDNDKSSNFERAILRYKKDKSNYIVAKAKEEDGTFKLYNLKIDKYNSKKPLNVSISSKTEISKKIENIIINNGKSTYLSSNYIEVEVSFNINKEIGKYKFNIDISGDREINLEAENKNAGYNGWNISNMNFSNFNILNNGNLSMDSSGEILNLTFNVNGYSKNEIYKNVNIYDEYGYKEDIRTIIENKNKQYTAVPDFNGDDSNIRIYAENLNEVSKKLGWQKVYVIKKNDFQNSGEVEFTTNKPRDLSKVVGVISQLSNNKKIFIVDGNLNINSKSDDILNIDNWVLISNGEINFENCNITSRTGTFEVVANNGIYLYNQYAKVDMNGSGMNDMNVYINKELIKKNVDDFVSLKNGLE